MLFLCYNVVYYSTGCCDEGLPLVSAAGTGGLAVISGIRVDDRTQDQG